MADEQQTSKKLLEKQQRRAAEEERRRAQQKAARKRNLVTLAIALLIGAVVVVLVLQSRDGDDVLAEGVGPGKAGCTEIEKHEDEGQDHVEVEPQYGTNPPTSGPHLQTPASAGFYDEPVRPGALVHNMEHGQIVLWYSPDASPETIDDVEALVEKEPSSTVAIPYPNVESAEGIVVTAWTVSMSCEKISEAAINDFRKEFQGKSPEPLTPPFEG